MIPIFKPSYGQEEIQAVSEVLLSGWVGLGPKVEEFEKKFADYIGVKYAVGVNSCTAALHLALKVLDVEGAEVITTPLTFVSTNHAILYNKAVPVFTDVDPESLNIDPVRIEESVTPKTKVLIAVHYGGNPCDMDRIGRIAEKRGLYVVEDAAHACGSEYRGKRIGSFGKLACFSFHAVKNLATGDGGMVVTNDRDMYERLIRLRWCGINKSTWVREGREGSEKYAWLYDVEEIGFKCHMNDITAALGLVQLGKLEAMNEKRRGLARLYDKGLSGLDWIRTPALEEHVKSARHNYVIMTDHRDELNRYLAGEGVSTGVHYYPNNMYRIYEKFGGNTPVARDLWSRLLTLPLYPDLSEDQADMIIRKIREFGGNALNKT